MKKLIAAIGSAAALTLGALPAQAAWTAAAALPADWGYCRGQEATIVGTPGDDVLTGTPGDDVILSFRGHDYVSGEDGNDIICTGRGTDDAYGGLGDDVILTGRANDHADGGPGNDYMRMGSTRIGTCNTFHAGDGRDLVVGGDGRECGADMGSGDDYFRGRGGNDEVYGSSGDDSLIGGSGSDTAFAGEGNDICMFEFEYSCER